MVVILTAYFSTLHELSEVHASRLEYPKIWKCFEKYTRMQNYTKSEKKLTKSGWCALTSRQRSTLHLRSNIATDMNICMYIQVHFVNHVNTQNQFPSSDIFKW